MTNVKRHYRDRRETWSLQIAPSVAVHGRVPLGKPEVKADISLDEGAKNYPAKEQFAVTNEVTKISSELILPNLPSLLDLSLLPILPSARVRKALSIFQTVKPKPKNGRWRWEDSYSKLWKLLF